MIKLQKYTPRVYYEQSRDFQFIGRLYDIVLNSVKTNSDLLYNLPMNANANTKLLDLMTMTLGFSSRHNYNVDQLKALCAAFSVVMKNKGNIQSIEMACNALVSAEGIKDEISIETDAAQNKIILYMPQDLSDTNLLRDLLDYILPAGMSFELVKTLKITKQTTTTIPFKSYAKYSQVHESHTSLIIDEIKDVDKETVDNESGIPTNKPFDEIGAFVNTTVTDTYINEPTTNGENKNE